ncbi:AsmA-like C-terminal domain-containing protein [Azospirillum sp.]|uniref:YhdP family protein n=1 Tax=Azospirillum sp. TaxID=34012 RepID=UPI002615A592|nr:AsmA-like C-terminal domain-containing protein [Azospirillum sp.]
MIRRTAKILGLTAAGAAVVVAAAAGLFVWRLAQGPIALDPFIPMVEEALSDPDGRFVAQVGELVLSLETEESVGEVGAGPRRIDVRARRARIVNADGVELAAAPEMGIGFSIPGLFLGKLAPTRLDLIRPRMTVLRRADGSLAFDVRSAPSPVDPDQPDAVEAERPDPMRELLASLRGAPDLNRPMGALRRLSVTGADLTMVNRMLGLSWHAKRADIVLNRDARGTEGKARLTLDVSQREGDRPVTVDASGSYRNGDAATELIVAFDGLNPASLASLGPALAPLAAVEVPVSGRTEAKLDDGFRPTRIAFDLKGGAGRVTVASLRPQPYAVAGMNARGLLDLSGRAVTLDALSLTLAGEDALTLAAQGAVTERDDTRTGNAALTLTTPNPGGPSQTTTVAITGTHGPDRVLNAALRLTDLRPDRLAGLAPALAPLAAAALPLSGEAEVALDRNFEPLSGRLAVTAGAGVVRRADLFDRPLPVASVELRLYGARGVESGAESRLEIDRLSLALGDAATGPRVEGKASVSERGGIASVNASVTARGVPLDDLAHYWPKPVGANAREWVTQNVAAGVVTEATATAALTVPLANPGAADLTQFGAVLRGENASVRYFHHLPPATGAAMEATTDGKTFKIQTKGGRVGDIDVGDGVVVIAGLEIGKETMDIRIPVSGPVRSILTLLDTPPLGYPSKLELDPKRTQGTAEAQLHFAFPLLADLSFDDLNLDVVGRMRGVGVEKVAAGMNATDGDLSLALDLKAMAIKGTTKLDGIPVTIDWKESFESVGRGPRTRIAVKGNVDAADLRSHGIDLEDRVLGPMGADILFTVDRNHKLALGATMNLEKTRLSIAELGWEKPPGQPGTGKLTLEFNKDRPTRISGLTVDAGGLKAQASLELADGGRRVARVVVPSLKVGQTDLRADVTVRPKSGATPIGYAGTISGESLDARKLMGKGEPGQPPPPPEPPDAKKTPLDLELKLNSVVFGDGRRLRQVAGTVRRDAVAWTLLDVAGRSGPGQGGGQGLGGAVSLSYKPGAKGLFDVAIRADDLGAALSAMDINDRVRGGRLRVTGRTTEPRADSPIEGQAEILDYTLIDVPVLARLLNAISPSGFAEFLEGGKGVNFGRMSANFRKQGPTLSLADLRTSGSALGLTLEGDVDLDRETANLRGTIVPIYGLNRLVGQIPLLGDLLSGGEGQGIFSATWRVRGRLSDPDVTVNPLAILAPGFLRNLFFLGEGGPSIPSKSAPSEPERPASGGLHER